MLGGVFLSQQLELKHISKTYTQGDRSVPVLNDLDLKVEAGTSLSIMGPSGSGKSTLLHIMGSLDQPTDGEVIIGDTRPFDLSEPDLAHFRNEAMGFVFQDHHLLPQYSVLENVLLPTVAFPGGPDRSERAKTLLERVGLSHRLDHRPSQLSGGERQRVAIARAMINQPSLLLCDEPTGNLDGETAESITDLILELHGTEGGILVVVTHNDVLAQRCSRPMILRDGRLIEAAEA